MASNHDHRHNPSASVGTALLKLGLSIGAAILKKKLVEKMSPKAPTEVERHDRNKEGSVWRKKA